MHAKMVELREGKQREIATIRITDGQLVIEGTLPELVHEEIVRLKEKTPDELAFFKMIALDYRGSWIQSRLLPN